MLKEYEQTMIICSKNNEFCVFPYSKFLDLKEQTRSKIELIGRRDGFLLKTRAGGKRLLTLCSIINNMIVKQIMNHRTRTEEKITNALVSLILEKGFETLSIAEVMARSGCSRGTFYLHYASLSDVLYSLEDRIIDEIFVITKHHYQSVEALLSDVANLVMQKRKPLRALFHATASHFSHKVEIVFEPVIASYPLTGFRSANEGFPYVATFIIDGGIGVFRHWLDEIHPQPKELLISGFANYFSLK
jgi:AcrR family transcriptional regulator